MNWDAIGAIGELVGAFAVVLTLLYLARETAKNSKSIDATSTRSVILQISEFNLEIAKDAELARIFFRSYRKEEQEYTEEEWYRFISAATSLVQIWQTSIMDDALGLGNNQQIQNDISFASYLFKNYPTWQKYWSATDRLVRQIAGPRAPILW